MGGGGKARPCCRTLKPKVKVIGFVRKLYWRHLESLVESRVCCRCTRICGLTRNTLESEAAIVAAA